MYNTFYNALVAVGKSMPAVKFHSNKIIQLTEGAGQQGLTCI